MPNETEVDVDEAEASEAAETGGGRAFWSGMLTFGLVSIPVDLLPATRSVVSRLHLLADAGKKVERRFYCPAHDEDVPKEHIVRGYETSAGTYVPVTDDELDALDPQKSREIDLRLFVPKDSVQARYFERAYFLVPSEDSGKAYALLTQALEARASAGIATFVMRDREYWVAIFASGGLLRAETLRFAEYVRSADDVGLPAVEEPASERAAQIRKLVKELKRPALPTSELQDEYAAAVAKLAQSKARSKKDVVHPELAEPSIPQSNVIDMVEVLKQRLAASGFDVKGSSAANDVQDVGSAKAPKAETAHASKQTAKPGVRKAPRRKSARENEERAARATPKRAAAGSGGRRTTTKKAAAAKRSKR